MIEVGKLRYGDVIVPTAGASGYVYVYLRQTGRGPAVMLVIGKHVPPGQIAYLWLADATLWNKV